jgi:branched-chain amino acid transport system substrate-binding protein
VKRLVVLALATALVVTGCSKGSDSGGGSDKTTGAADTSPIKLYQQTVTQSPGTSLPFMVSSAKAAVAEINAGGGVKGRQLELTSCNEAGDPNIAVKCAQTAVQDKDYVAIVGGFTQYGAQVNPVMEAGKIANIGPDAVSPVDAKTPVNFLFDLGVPGYSAMPAVAKKYLNATKIAVMLLDNTTRENQQGYFEAGAKVSGVTIVKSIAIPIEATDYTQFVAQADASGATVVVSGMSPNNNLALWKAIQSTGSKLKTVMSDGGVSKSLITQAGNAAVEGDYVVNGIPATDTSNATGTAYNASMAKYAPDEKVIAGVGMRAWLSVQLFAKVANTIDGPITRASVLAAMQKVKNLKFYWLDSLSFDKPGPLSEYPRIVTPISFPSKLSNGNYVPQDSFNPYQK